MNNQEISNPKKNVPDGPNMNEKDYLTSLNSILKEMEKNYATAMTEASNEVLYGKFKEVFYNVTSLQREVYELMFKNGWYSLEKAETQKINNKYQTLDQEYKGLGI